MIRTSGAIIAYQGKILLFLRDGKPDRDPNTWSLIGGHVEEGETHDEALVREVEEEISIKPTNYTLLIRTTGEFDEEIYLYEIQLTPHDVPQIRLGDEGQKVAFFRLDEIAQLPLSTNLATFMTTHKQLFEEVLENSNK